MISFLFLFLGKTSSPKELSQLKSKFKNDITLRWKIVTDIPARDGVYFGYNISFYNRNRSKRILTASLAIKRNSHIYTILPSSLTYLPSSLTFIIDGYLYCSVRDIPINESSLFVDVFAFNNMFGNGYISTIEIKCLNKDISFNGIKFYHTVLF